MHSRTVLVAFASQTGSTAGIARVIASELHGAGFSVDCRPASDATDVTPYSAVILGSGVFLPRRATDGGGFLARHREELASRRVWLYCVGPIGRGRGTGESCDPGDCAVTEVARAIGARGSAAFGALGASAPVDPMELLAPVDLARVRAWARTIASELAAEPARVRWASVAAVL